MDLDGMLERVITQLKTELGLLDQAIRIMQQLSNVRSGNDAPDAGASETAMGSSTALA